MLNHPAYHYNAEKGFTMVELMVVVVIIAILIAIAIPVYSNIVEHAERSAVEATLRNLDGSILLYFSKEGVYPATDWDGGVYLTGWPSGPNDAIYSVSNGNPPRARVSGYAGGTILVNESLPMEW